MAVAARLLQYAPSHCWAASAVPSIVLSSSNRMPHRIHNHRYCTTGSHPVEQSYPPQTGRGMQLSAPPLLQVLAASLVASSRESRPLGVAADLLSLHVQLAAGGQWVTLAVALQGHSSPTCPFQTRVANLKRELNTQQHVAWRGAFVPIRLPDEFVHALARDQTRASAGGMPSAPLRY